jgi:predicted RNA-binding Zn-ribbon protein involved in translation (DUF1610 family)
MPRFDWKCPNCGFVEEMTIPFAESKAGEATYACPHCKGRDQIHWMTRQIPTTNFAIKGFSAKNGYSKA